PAAAGAGCRSGDPLSHQIHRRSGPLYGWRRGGFAGTDRAGGGRITLRRPDHEPLQCLGISERSGNSVHSYAGPQRQRAGTGAMAGTASGGGESELLRPAIAPAVRTGPTATKAVWWCAVL